MTAWAEIIPSVIASVITTLLTLFVAWISRRVSTNRAVKNESLMLRRGTGSGWTITNVSKRTVVDVQMHVLDGQGQLKEQGHQYAPSILRPNESCYLQDLEEDDSITVNWLVLRKPGREYFYSAEARVKKSEEVIALRQTKHSGHRNGGGK